MSKLEDDVYGLLKQAFKFYKIKKQFYIRYNGQKLLFDFFIPDLCVLIECQGKQHYEYGEFFFETEKDFQEAQWRDTLKKEWAETKGFHLIEIPYNDIPKDAEEIFCRVYERVIT
jgi:very-short-patch-repair endonuclease